MNCSCYNSQSDRETKHVTVCINGYPLQRLKIPLVNKKIYKWHKILEQITQKISPHFGNVTKLYTCDSGVTIYSFSELIDNETYVASNCNKYRPVKGGYKIIGKSQQCGHYCPKQLNRNNKKIKLTCVRPDLTVIYVYCSGKKKNKAKFVLSKYDLKGWDKTLKYIALILDMPSIRGLYAVNGDKICGPMELQHGASYVAAACNEQFTVKSIRIRNSLYHAWKFGKSSVERRSSENCCFKKKRKKLKSWEQKLDWKKSTTSCCCSKPSKNLVTNCSNVTNNQENTDCSTSGYCQTFKPYIIKRFRFYIHE